MWPIIAQEECQHVYSTVHKEKKAVEQQQVDALYDLATGAKEALRWQKSLIFLVAYEQSIKSVS